ncbi:hypothetical protein R3I94_004672 [Phoxinus phoxinus]
MFNMTINSKPNVFMCVSTAQYLRTRHSIKREEGSRGAIEGLLGIAKRSQLHTHQQSGQCIALQDHLKSPIAPVLR